MMETRIAIFGVGWAAVFDVGLDMISEPISWWWDLMLRRERG